MSTLFDLELARERRQELLGEARERRIARALLRARRGVEKGRSGVTRGLHDVSWGLAEKESTASYHST
jgi:hypothetical protein